MRPLPPNAGPPRELLEGGRLSWQQQIQQQQQHWTLLSCHSLARGRAASELVGAQDQGPT